MARVKNRLPSNVPGNFYVDSSCIDCGACEWLAPETFEDDGGKARVFRQPFSAQERIRALGAVLACPVAAIGTIAKQDFGEALDLFPEGVDGPVSYCGYHSPRSFGAASYLIRRPEGNILVDSPRFAAPLVKRLEAMGGVSLMVLTHKDDVADHKKFHSHFGCRRILHEADLTQDTRDVEILLKGNGIHRLDSGTLLVPVPGHTPGSICLLWRETYLFSGDHLSWDPGQQTLKASKTTCWFDWEKQRASMERLTGFRFEWVLPGHGVRCHLPARQMSEELTRCIAAMEFA